MNKFTINAAKFAVNIDGIDMKDCTAVSGFQMAIEKLLDDNGAQATKQYRKGQTYVDDIDFTRVFADAKIYDWFKECQQGRVTKRSVSIITFTDKGDEALRFNLEGCWPILWTGPSFSAGQESAIACESFKLAVEAIEIV